MRTHLPASVLTVLVGCAVAFADDAALWRQGGAVQMMKGHPSVAMERMEVDIRLHPEREALVECEFAFRNTGPATTVAMGFPESGSKEEAPVREPRAFTSFATWVDGQEVATRIEGAQQTSGSWHQWRVKTIAFAAGQTRHVRVRYTQGMGAEVLGSHFFDYLIGSGGSWKGPIGHVRVRIRTDHHPAVWRLTLPTGFRETGAGILEWIQRNYEPRTEETIRASYQPLFARIAIGAGDAGDSVRMTPASAQGHLVAGVRYVAHLMLAEVHCQWPSVMLTLGDRAVMLRNGSQWAEVNGRPFRLSSATFVEEGKLQVPLAAVARALGAQVDYLPATRTVRILSPFERIVDVALPAQKRYGAWSSLRVSCARGYAPLDLAQYPGERLAELRRAGSPSPTYCTGDFNGDGLTDLVLLMCRGEELNLGIVQPHENAPGVGVFWLDRFPRDAGWGLSPAGWSVFVRTVAPAKITYIKDEGSTPGELELKRQAVEIVFEGSASILYYFDEATRKYQKVWTSE